MEKKQGMKIIPTGERKCIWMEAGAVTFKLCTNQYQCSTCEFDLAMSNRAKQNKIAAAENRPAVSNKKPFVEWTEEFRNLPADQRKCRYMISGEVSHKICPNSFRCGECSFDQMMQDRLQPTYLDYTDTMDKIAGFYLHESLYYFRNHTWLELERNGKFRVGLDDFARRILGQVDGIELPAVGRDLEFEEYAWTIKHKQGDLQFLSPVKGIVDSVNLELLDNPSMLTEAPYSKGWLMTIDPKSIMRSNKNFLKGKEARAWMMEEAGLLNHTINPDAGVTLHDGAVIDENFSEKITPDQWQELVKKHLFIK